MSNISLTEARKISAQLKHEAEDGHISSDRLERLAQKTKRTVAELKAIARDVDISVDLPQKSRLLRVPESAARRPKSNLPVSDLVLDQIRNAGIFKRLSPKDLDATQEEDDKTVVITTFGQLRRERAAIRKLLDWMDAQLATQDQANDTENKPDLLSDINLDDVAKRDPNSFFKDPRNM